MKVITTADKFRVTEGQLVWLASCGTYSVRKVGLISGTAATLVDPLNDGDANHVYGSRLFIFHPETGLRANDFAHDAVEVSA